MLCRLYAYAFLAGDRTVVLAIQALSRVCSVPFRGFELCGSVSTGLILEFRRERVSGCDRSHDDDDEALDEEK